MLVASLPPCKQTVLPAILRTHALVKLVLDDERLAYCTHPSMVKKGLSTARNFRFPDDKCVYHRNDLPVRTRSTYSDINYIQIWLELVHYGDASGQAHA